MADASMTPQQAQGAFPAPAAPAPAPAAAAGADLQAMISQAVAQALAAQQAGEGARVAAAVKQALADKQAADAEASRLGATLCEGCGGGGRKAGQICPDCSGSGAEKDTQRYKEKQASKTAAAKAA